MDAQERNHAATSEAPARSPETSPFDYIIVGSGAGGGPLACRLAEAGKKVLLVEAGQDPKEALAEAAKRSGQRPEDATAVLEAPLFHGASTEDETLSWQYSVRHYEDDARQREDHKYDAERDPSSPSLDPAKPGSPPIGSGGKGGIFYPRSSGIGGCTGHHAMIVIRPNDRDWQQIADLTGDESWSPDNMGPYFAKFEQCLYIDEYRGFLSAVLGWFYTAFLAVMRFINPKSVLDEGGHGRKGWQPTSFIPPKLITRIVATDAEFTKVLVRSAFKVIEDSSTLTAVLKRMLVTLGFVRAFDPNDNGTRADNPDGGVFLIPTGIGGDKVRDEDGHSTKGRRAGVREFILKTQKAHPDRLVIAKGVHVTEVLFDRAAGTSGTPRAIGVKGIRGEDLYRASPKHGRAIPQGEVQFFVRHAAEDRAAAGTPTFKAAGEVVLCGGSFNTPQLLMLSGIGPGTELAKHGIRGRVVLPGVGRNLQDRYEVGVVSELRDDLRSLDTIAFDPTDPEDKLLAEWKAKREGLYATNGGTIAVLQRSAAADGPEPDLLTFGAPAAFRGYYWRWSKELLRPVKGAPCDQRNLWTWVILKAYTRNDGGTVRLRSADPLDTPDICFNSFDQAEKQGGGPGWADDVDAMVEAIGSMREITQATGTAFAREIQPAGYLEAANAGRAAKGLPPWSLRDWIINEAWGHHACGTCRMGSDRWQADAADLSDKNAFLDSHFRVHGVRGLRVVDASVFPKIPGYFILAPIFMVSEKAAETFLHERCDAVYPDEIRDLETAAIAKRRSVAAVDQDNVFVPPARRPVAAAAAGCDADGGASERPMRNVVGLALSGGGIRSATFSLGVVQELAAKGRLRHIDFLSTVSGGAFTGSFLGRLFTRKMVTSSSDPCGRAQDILADNRSGPLRWLRSQSDYLVASGTNDWLIAVGIFFRNLFAVHIVVGALVFALFALLAGTARSALFSGLLAHPPGPSMWGPVTPSAWWWVPVAMLGGVVVPMTLGYWLAPKTSSYRAHPPYPFAAWVVLIAGASVALGLSGSGLWAGGALGILGLAWLWQESARRGLPETTTRQLQQEGSAARNRLSRGLGEALLLFAGTVVWVGLDSLAGTVAGKRHLGEAVGVFLALAPGLRLLRTWADRVLPKGDGADAATMLKLTAVLLALLLLFVVDVAAHKLFLATSPVTAWAVVSVALLFSVVLGRAYDFLNLTSLHATYSSRIVRTFLGATNTDRTSGKDAVAADVSIAQPGDDIPHHLYRPEDHGGPLHLISVCVNETVDHASQRHDATRKGTLMTVGSFGASVGRRYFATWSRRVEVPAWLRFRRWVEGIDLDQDTPPTLDALRIDADPGSFHPLARRDGYPAVVQGLSLGDWVGTSGAAFSTGRGRSTNALEALFMGIVNLRLGFWWDSGIRATERPGRYPANVWRRLKELPSSVFRTQFLLLSEWTARFGGPSCELWNLSDGGHLDNSSLYELVRRRVPFIIATDATRDVGYAFDDLGTWVEAVRVDFGAEVVWVAPSEFTLSDAVEAVPPAIVRHWIALDDKHLTDGPIGSLGDIKGNPSHGGPGTKHAAIARIVYQDRRTPDSWLLMIKASLTGDEPLDVARFAKLNPDFPQDSTADQFFDENRWESYRRLGQKAAAAVIR